MSESTPSLPASNGKTVLITGINGYIASVTGLAVLKKGYTLIGTCRSRLRVGDLLKDAYAEYDRAGRVKIVEVDVHGIIHTASPIDTTLTNPALVIGPAVAGTTGILYSALKHSSPQLSAIVVTSSAGAVVSPPTDGRIFAEDDWNNYAGKLVEEAAGADCPPHVCYSASKTAAEKSIWTFREKEKPQFAISAVNPTLVYGPPIITHPNPSYINETLRPIYMFLTGTTPDGAMIPKIATGGYVDVRDVATAHVWALEHPSVSDGQRYLVSAGLGPPQAMADVLRAAYPSRRDLIPVGTPGEGYVKGTYAWIEGGTALSTKKLEEAMGGIKWIQFEKCILDTAKFLERYLERES